ncbi:MAG: glutamate racemase [Elusimicrobiota bacterium]
MEKRNLPRPCAQERGLPIGIFDSGLGGLTVVREVLGQLPDESIIYFGDTARVPYGTKSADVVKKYSLQIMNFLLKKKVKMIVIACNTASSYAAEILKKKSCVSVIEMIEPGARAALRSTACGRIGVIGTEGTIKSKSYERMIKSYNPDIKVFSKACPLFVPLVEEGWIDGTHTKIVKKIAQEYLLPLKKKNIDVLILGCTHYPLLKDVISSVMGKRVTIVDSAQSAAYEIKTTLYTTGLKSVGLKTGRISLFVSDSPQKCDRVAKRILMRKISHAVKVNLELNTTK